MDWGLAGCNSAVVPSATSSLKRSSSCGARPSPVRACSKSSSSVGRSWTMPGSVTKTLRSKRSAKSSLSRLEGLSQSPRKMQRTAGVMICKVSPSRFIDPCRVDESPGISGRPALAPSDAWRLRRVAPSSTSALWQSDDGTAKPPGDPPGFRDLNLRNVGLRMPRPVSGDLGDLRSRVRLRSMYFVDVV